MRDEDADLALQRLTGGLLIACGVLIATLCGGCTLNVLRQPGGAIMAPLVVIIGGAPTALGLALAWFGWRKLPPRHPVASPATAKGGFSTVVGWALIGFGVIIALTAFYQAALDGWILWNAIRGKLGGPGNAGSLAFVAALEHALLFLLAAGIVELGRRIRRRGL